MTYKQEYLIDKGYNKDDVLRVSSFSDKELELALNAAFSVFSKNITSKNNPKCIYIGGQPGVGKSVLSSKLKERMDAIELSMDACRMFHPRYLEMEELTKSFYKDKIISNDNNPSNDIASFTHDFAANMINRLIDMSSENKYNIILEWNMRHSSDVLNCMTDLKNKGYYNEAFVMTSNKELSLEACKIRADAMNSHGHIVRRVSEAFHEMCINSIPDSVNKIYEEGKKSKVLDKMRVITRDGTIKWDDTKDMLPGDVIRKIYDEKSIKDINKREYGDISFAKESIGLNSKLIKLMDLKQDLIEYKNNSGKVVNL